MENRLLLLFKPSGEPIVLYNAYFNAIAVWCLKCRHVKYSYLKQENKLKVIHTHKKIPQYSRNPSDASISTIAFVL